jgi:hypothetical protein
MHYKGGCHCGKIKFSLDGDLTGATSCNCSICQRKGHLLWFVPAAQVQLDALPQDVGTYTFNKHHIAHHFLQNLRCQPIRRWGHTHGRQNDRDQYPLH